MNTVSITSDGPVRTITITRPEVRNAVDGPTAEALADAFRKFERDDDAFVAVLTGAGGHFCAGADLKAMANEPQRANRVAPDGDGPMGPTRAVPVKPVIAAVEGYCVAGGLELALWCDLRVAARDATFGFFDRRWGVPLIDGGTIRLPRVIGASRALDMIITGRPVPAEEAYAFGLANRLADPGGALDGALELARDIARFPQLCMRADRLSAVRQWDLPFPDALMAEFEGGMQAVASGETQAGAARFASGEGRHGDFS
jgi:enoyl-CoA hydratase